MSKCQIHPEREIFQHEFCFDCVESAIILFKKSKTNPLNGTNQIRSSHYDGADNPYEAIKVIDNWKANFNLGNAIKYICRVCNRYYSMSSKEGFYSYSRFLYRRFKES